MARTLRTWAINRGGKNSVRNLLYGPRTRLVRGMYLCRANCKQVMLWISVDGEDMLASNYMKHSPPCFVATFKLPVCRKLWLWLPVCYENILKLHNFLWAWGCNGYFLEPPLVSGTLSSATSFPDYQVFKSNHYLWNLLWPTFHMWPQPLLELKVWNFLTFLASHKWPLDR